MPKDTKRKTGRPPLPPDKRLKDGLTLSQHEWLDKTAQRLSVSKQHILRVAIAWMQKRMKGKEAEVDITIQKESS